MFAYHTPGVYFESLDTQPPSILPLRTDIAGFVGIAQRGPYHCPVKVDSWTQFTSTFGRFIPQGYLAYAVEGFFANGGQTCYVVRVLDPMVACPATLELPGEGGPADKPVLTLTASSPGVWGEDIVVTVIRLGADSFSLILQLADGGQELWRDLTLSTVANVLGNGKSSSRLVSANRASPEATPPRAGTYRLGDPTRLGSQPGRDGLATLTLAHFSGVGAPPDKRWGLATLDLVDEVSIVAMPDIVPKSIADIKFVPPPVRCDAVAAPLLPKHELSDSPEYPPPFQDDEILALQGQLIGHCERLKDRMAILDAPQPLMSPEAVRQWRKQFDSKYAALYYPWLRMPDPQGLEGLLRNIPPSGHVAGIYARVEQQVGVHKPPANELVERAQDVTVPVNDIIHGVLNDAPVNVIRVFPGRGLRVAGARTLNDDPDWRYVSVRRLLIMLERAIDQQTQWMVFEPNNPALWRDVERVVRSFLDDLWRRGMLDGATAEEAYLVRCDATTNPPAETDVGRLICQIGLHLMWPAEFVIVRIGKTESGTQILEGTGG